MRSALDWFHAGNGLDVRFGAFLFVAAQTTGLLLGSEASAQSEYRDPTGAEALFQEGRKLMDKGQPADACPKLAESQRLDPAVGTLMYLALCYEQTGKTASAWSTYRAAESAAKNSGQAERSKIARERAEALEPRLSRLVIRVSADHTAGVEITRDGVRLGEASWGVPIPVDPGQHVIAASASGKKAWSTTVEVASGAAEMAVDVPRLQAAAASSPATDASGSRVVGPVPGGRPSTGDAGADQRDRSSSPSTLRWVGVSVGALGLVGVGLGAVFAARASSKEDDAEKYRRPGTSLYDGPGYDLNQEALDSSKLALWSFVLGGAAVAGGAVLYFTAPRGKTNPAQARVLTAFGPTGGSIALAGGWR